MRAAKVYIAHNHISNIATPSKTDWQTTAALQSILSSIGVELVDHLIFVDGDMVSMADSDHKLGFQFL